jgi:transposase-like protein
VRNLAKKLSPGEVVEQRILHLAEVIRRELREFVHESGFAALQMLLEEERTAVCGPRYAHHDERQAYRSGSVDGELTFGGRRVRVRRPRVRSTTGREVILPSWAKFSDEDPLSERAVEQMLVGVSTRRYERSLEDVGDVPVRGTSKSAVSRRFVEITQKEMEQWCHRDISSCQLVALMIDGVHIGEHVIVIVLGIDVNGCKHVLGLREGSTENSATVTALLSDLQDRGLQTNHRILAVIDGGKALAKGLREIFGDNIVIQRCQAHKVRNVTEQLPETRRRAVSIAMWRAYRCGSHRNARRLLENLALTIERSNPGASASLREGLEETLNVMRFSLPTTLERTLATTNLIENLIGTVRKTTARVHRWRDGAMIVRWASTAVIDAEKRFLRAPKAQAMKKLFNALQNMDRIDQIVAVA